MPDDHDAAPPLRPAANGLEALLSSYDVAPQHHDELLSDAGVPKAYWQAFARHAGDLSATRLSDAQDRVERQIFENGVTYNVYAATDGPTRPWGLDVLPFIVPAVEWEHLARGLRQRARLLNAVAGDLYGAQRLLGEGLIPAALVLAHPGFLRACHGTVPPQGTFLHLLAFDIGRGPDGHWRVIGTRTQAPSGAGYALENRISVSRLFPEAFREQRVQLLARFFRTVQETLIAASHCGHESPHIVLLTPGPYNETYFEHAYLARYLGFTLAEGGDLVVRDDRVHLKTLAGLRRVHAIVRRLDDDFCDPLELRADSTLGVTGLLRAWRAGNVLVANALGTSVLESPSLLAFLPAICKRLLGETLDLSSIATWWCGEAAARADVESRLDEMIIKPAFPSLALEPVFLGGVGSDERTSWLARIDDAPEQYVLEEFLPLSHAPVWHDGRLESRAVMLRVFAVADGRGDYQVMPGGLCRIAGSDRQIVSSQRGGSSKDMWVLSDAPVERFSMLPGRVLPEDAANHTRLVSSRAGENLFWLGRYAERSENCARLLRAVLSRMPDSDAFPDELSRLVASVSTRQGLLAAASGNGNGADTETRLVVPAVEASHTAHMLEQSLIAGLFDREGCRSLAFNVEQMVRVAGTVRDRLSSDNWRVLNQLFLSLRTRLRRDGLADVLELLDRTVVALVAVGGLEMAHMTRDDGWRFLSLGRHLERALYVTTSVAAVASSGEAEDPTLLEWLLDLSDSLITYRARYMRHPEWVPVAELLVFDRHNPRSALFQLAKLAKHVRLLPDANFQDLLAGLDRACAASYRTNGSQRELFDRDVTLELFLDTCEKLALSLSDALTLRYFSHVYEPTRATALL